MNLVCIRGFVALSINTRTGYNNAFSKVKSNCAKQT